MISSVIISKKYEFTPAKSLNEHQHHKIYHDSSQRQRGPFQV